MVTGDECEPHGYEEFMAGVDARVIGSGTYETVLAFDGWPYGDKPVVVLSNTLSKTAAPAGAACERMSGSPESVAAQLAARGMQHLYIDGGVTIQGFLRAGLIQRLTITRIPVLLGSGIPLCGAVPSDIRLQHQWTRTFPSGMVQSEHLISAD